MSTLSDNAIAHKLLEAAVRLFAHKGYPATSTREIVEAAGVTKPMLYYYFQSKEGLLEAALAHFSERFQLRLRTVVDEAVEPRERLIELVWAHLDFCQQHKPLARLFYALFFGPDDQKHLVDLEKYIQATHSRLSDAVRRAIAARIVRPGCEDTLQMALRGMIHIWVMAALNDDVELDWALAERIVDDLLRGFHHD